MGNDSREKERGENGGASPSKDTIDLEDTIDLGHAPTSLNQYSHDKSEVSKPKSEVVNRHG